MAGAVVLAAATPLLAAPRAAAEPAATPTAPVAFDTAPAVAAIERLVGKRSDIDLVALAPNGTPDHYRVTGTATGIRIEGTSPATLMTGFNAYLGAVLHQSVSWNKDNVHLPAKLPAPKAPVTAEANVDHRFINNDTEDGYTGPYRTWADWQRAIDVYAFHGINDVFMPVGAEAVYLDTLQKFGYSTDELLNWIPLPAHQPWWLLQNMSQYPAPMTEGLVNERAALGRKIADRLRELGMTPVLPGYFGTVPADFASRNPGADVVPQGNWCGFVRPDWLNPAGSVFADLAAEFYKNSENRFGASTMYKADLLHEGGKAGDVSVPDAARAVQAAMQTAHPGATWVLLGWQSNPPAGVIDAVNPATTFIVDGLSDRYPNLDRDTQWKGIPYAFGSIWNFGGHTTMGAQLSTWNTRYFDWLNHKGSAMNGVALMPEGGDNNPVVLDFLTSLAWAKGPANLASWFDDWSLRRYGVADSSASAAWQILADTAYNLPTNDGMSEAQDSLYNAQPSFGVSTAAAWSPTKARYDMDEFAKALPLLLHASDAVKATDTYKYDLMDVARQVLTNTSRLLLPQLSDAFNAKDVDAFTRLSKDWLANMDLLDSIVGTQEQNLLGRWIEQARDAGSSSQEKAALEKDARSIVTTWGGPAAVAGGLNDYANREWQGLVGGYYKERWQTFLNAKLTSLTTGEPAAAIDWGAMGQAFINDTSTFRSTPSGDILQLAAKVPSAWDRAHKPLPAPPRAGVTYVSDMQWAQTQTDPSFGPIERDTEIGDAAAGDGKPIRLAGTPYAKGVGVNSPTTIDLNLAGVCQRFDSVAGIDDVMDKPDADPSVIFQVLGDGKKLYDSGTARAADPRTVSLDVAGVKQLQLVVDPDAAAAKPGDGVSWWDRADWADAKVTCTGATPFAVNNDATFGGVDKAVNIDVLTNDSGDGLTVSTVGQPSHGNAATSGTARQITYTPAQGFTGHDTFTYTVTDDYGQSADGTVTVTVLTAPIAQPIQVATPSDTAVTIDPIKAVTGTGLTINVVSAPAHGTAAIVGDGASATVRYAPARGYIGADAFEVTVRDAAGQLAVVHVTATVTAGTGPSPSASTEDGSIPNTGMDMSALWAATALIVGGAALLVVLLVRRRRQAAQ